MKALVGPEDGLVFFVKGEPLPAGKRNILSTRVKGPEGKKDIDVRRFFVMVETTGTVGGAATKK